MADPYLYADTPVLKNKLDIRDEKVLDLVEAEQSRANMMLLYEREFSDFTPAGLCEIHRFLFGDIYDWAGEYRIINIEKREKLLAGRSVSPPGTTAIRWRSLTCETPLARTDTIC